MFSEEFRRSREILALMDGCSLRAPTGATARPSNCANAPTDDEEQWRLDDASCLIVETKGQEDLDVALKDRRARRWCQDATRLSGRD
ncbi:MAG: hypothetical protein M3370_03115 [Actinomycetota bacterium]|nr:hypothetical protein [Actinomycetota bacterium]